jgi:hypothetical protein
MLILIRHEASIGGASYAQITCHTPMEAQRGSRRYLGVDTLDVFFSPASLLMLILFAAIALMCYCNS